MRSQCDQRSGYAEWRNGSGVCRRPVQAVRVVGDQWRLALHAFQRGFERVSRGSAGRREIDAAEIALDVTWLLRALLPASDIGDRRRADSGSRFAAGIWISSTER